MQSSPLDLSYMVGHTINKKANYLNIITSWQQTQGLLRSWKQQLSDVQAFYFS